MDSYEKSLQTLELPAVLALLAAQAVSETARAQAMALRPSGDRAVVATRLGETSAAASMMVVKGSPSFSGVKDVRAALQRADMGGALNTRELLDIAGVLQAARCVRSYGTGERQRAACSTRRASTISSALCRPTAFWRRRSSPPSPVRTRSPTAHRASWRPSAG